MNFECFLTYHTAESAVALMHFRQLGSSSGSIGLFFDSDCVCLVNGFVLEKCSLSIMCEQIYSVPITVESRISPVKSASSRQILPPAAS